MNTPLFVGSKSLGWHAGSPASGPKGLEVVKSNIGPWPSKDISEIKTAEDELTLLIFPQIFKLMNWQIVGVPAPVSLAMVRSCGCMVLLFVWNTMWGKENRCYPTEPTLPLRHLTWSTDRSHWHILGIPSLNSSYCAGPEYSMSEIQSIATKGL